MEEKKETTLGDLIRSDSFQRKLAAAIRDWFGKYDNIVMRLGGRPKRNPTLRLREMKAEDPKVMTGMYIRLLNHKSELPTALRNVVWSICEPVLTECISEYKRQHEAQ